MLPPSLSNYWGGGGVAPLAPLFLRLCRCKTLDASPMAHVFGLIQLCNIKYFKLISVATYGDEVFRMAFLVTIVKNM